MTPTSAGWSWLSHYGDQAVSIGECLLRVTMHLFAGLARFPSKQEDSEGEGRGDGIPGDGKFAV